MSDPISANEIDGRIEELCRQRDMAFNQAVIYAGHLAKLKDENAKLNTRIAQLQSQIETEAKESA
jgi:cell division protein FtsB